MISLLRITDLKQLIHTISSRTGGAPSYTHKKRPLQNAEGESIALPPQFIACSHRRPLQVRGKQLWPAVPAVSEEMKTAQASSGDTLAR